MNKKINVKDFNAVRQAGIESLIKDLGVIGAVNFIRQFDMGYGDYTKEREQYNNKSVMDIVNEIKGKSVIN